MLLLLNSIPKAMNIFIFMWNRWNEETDIKQFKDFRN